MIVRKPRSTNGRSALSNFGGRADEVGEVAGVGAPARRHEGSPCCLRLGPSVAQEDREADAQLDRRDVAADVTAVIAEDRELATDLVQVA